ncbi:hypothetical protein DID88_003711 [Monilinia fructigena]|uniref:Uncharacterized protein n=1 Tax=Monilinia fructigena TaxID=38457 RepID=A0A395IVF4_9HELO|nr:hypothetical protein DID88_003711 [Monilinia fructigena]
MSARAFAVVPIPLIVGSAERSSSVRPSFRAGVSQLIRCLIAFDTHVAWGPFNANLVSVYEGMTFEESPLGGVGRVCPHAPYHRGAVDAHPYPLVCRLEDIQCTLQAFKGAYRLCIEDMGDAVYRSTPSLASVLAAVHSVSVAY